ncbi:hypothetical protein PR048_029358 [Dryococelus australis]|uniref:Uncharacterized protein n=1 Tax=Dryococelus australis TaxID=614101 RepID=A0ABQ9GD53_9NEOP|nr:hypothetical protein PR048_029358 [Dryococelus australis]
MEIIPQSTMLLVRITAEDESTARESRHGKLLPNTVRAIIAGPNNCVKGLKFFLFSDNTKIVSLDAAKRNSVFVFDDVSGKKQNTMQKYFSMGRHATLKLALLHPEQTDSKFRKLSRRYGIAPNSEIFLTLNTPQDISKLTLVPKFHTPSPTVAIDPHTDSVKSISRSPDTAMDPAIYLDDAKALFSLRKFQCSKDMSLTVTRIFPHQYVLTNLHLSIAVLCVNTSLSSAITNHNLGSVELHVPCGCRVTTPEETIVEARRLCDVRALSGTLQQTAVPAHWLNEQTFPLQQLYAILNSGDIKDANWHSDSSCACVRATAILNQCICKLTLLPKLLVNRDTFMNFSLHVTCIYSECIRGVGLSGAGQGYGSAGKPQPPLPLLYDEPPAFVGRESVSAGAEKPGRVRSCEQDRWCMFGVVTRKGGCDRGGWEMIPGVLLAGARNRRPALRLQKPDVASFLFFADIGDLHSSRQRRTRTLLGGRVISWFVWAIRGKPSSEEEHFENQEEKLGVCVLPSLGWKKGEPGSRHMFASSCRSRVVSAVVHGSYFLTSASGSRHVSLPNERRAAPFYCACTDFCCRLTFHASSFARKSSPGSLSGFRKWEPCRTMPLVGGFSRGSPASPALAFRRCSILTSFHPHRISRPRLLRAAHISQPLLGLSEKKKKKRAHTKVPLEAVYATYLGTGERWTTFTDRGKAEMAGSLSPNVTHARNSFEGSLPGVPQFSFFHPHVLVRVTRRNRKNIEDRKRDRRLGRRRDTPQTVNTSSRDHAEGLNEGSIACSRHSDTGDSNTSDQRPVTPTRNALNLCAVLLYRYASLCKLDMYMLFTVKESENRRSQVVPYRLYTQTTGLAHSDIAAIVELREFKRRDGNLQQTLTRASRSHFRIFRFVYFETTRIPPRPGRSRIFACGDSTGRCRWSAGVFSGISRFPLPFTFRHCSVPRFALVGSEAKFSAVVDFTRRSDEVTMNGLRQQRTRTRTKKKKKGNLQVHRVSSKHLHLPPEGLQNRRNYTLCATPTELRFPYDHLTAYCYESVNAVKP